MCMYFLSMFDEVQRGQASSALNLKIMIPIMQIPKGKHRNNQLWSANPEEGEELLRCPRALPPT